MPNCPAVLLLNINHHLLQRFNIMMKYLAKNCSAHQCKYLLPTLCLLYHICLQGAGTQKGSNCDYSLYWEPFRAGFQTENRNRAHFLLYFPVFRSFRTISIETETEVGMYQSQLKVVTFVTKMWPHLFCWKKKNRRTNSVTNSNLWQFVTVTNVTNWSHIQCDWYKAVSVSVWKSGSERL